MNSRIQVKAKQDAWKEATRIADSTAAAPKEIGSLHIGKVYQGSVDFMKLTTALKRYHAPTIRNRPFYCNTIVLP
jgi:hypothetical protein